MRRLCLTFVLVVSACGKSGPDPRPVVTDGGVFYPGDYEDPFVRRSRLDTGTFLEIQEVRARNETEVFFCTGVRGLLGVDASDPDSMRVTHHLASSLGSGSYPRCQHVAFDDDLVYMASRGDEIQPTPFVAAFDLATSQEVATFRRAGASVEGIDAAGGLLYAAVHENGLLVLERSGTELVERATLTGLTNAWSVRVSGDRAYVADGAGGLAVVDVSNPSQPRILGRVATGGAAQALDVDGQHAFVAAGAAGLVIVDVSDPQAPVVVGQADTPGSALAVAVENGRAYVADWHDARVYDVTDPSAPAFVAKERVATGSAFSRVLGIGAAGNLAFIGEWTGFYSYELIPGRTAPDVGVSERSIEFGQIAPGGADALALILRNEGTEPLVAWQIETDRSELSVDRPQFVIPAGGADVLELLFQPQSKRQISGNLRIYSDDPDESPRTIPVVGNRSGLGVGDPAPEVVVSLVGGGQWRLSEQRGQVVVLAYFATF